MPRPIIRGTAAPIRKSVNIRHDPTQGTTTTQQFESAGDNLTGLARQFADKGANYNLNLSPYKSSLEVVETQNIYAGGDVGGGEVLSRWELLSNQQQLDLKEHPRFANLNPNQKWQIIKDVERHLDGRNAAAGLDWDDPDVWGEPSVIRAQKFYNLLIRGTTHFMFPQWVIRVTYNVGDYETSIATNGGIGTVFSTAQLGIPSGRIRSVVQSITPPAAVTGMTWGWLQVSHTEATSARNRVDVSEEAWLGQWPDIIYGGE